MRPSANVASGPSSVKAKMKGVKVFVGGIIPEDDIKKLKKMGVAGIFTPGTPLKDIIDIFENS